MKTIEIANVGAVERLSIPIPDAGGIVVLRGRNGSGKTTALEAVDAAVSGTGKPPIRDNELSAEVNGLGVKMTLGKSKRVRGELECITLEDRYDIAKLVNGGNLKDQEAADAVRVKSLVHLAHVKPDRGLFYSLAGGREPFEKLVPPHDTDTDDLVVMAMRIKRRFEEHARLAEGAAQTAEGRAEACAKSAEGRDLSGESNKSVLQAALEQAIAAKSKLEAEAVSAESKIIAARQAREKLETAKASYSGVTLEQARAQCEAVKIELKERSDAVIDAERVLAEAKSAYTLTDAKLEAVDAAWTGARDYERLTAQWSEQIAAGENVEEVEPCAIDQAKADVQAARKRVEEGVLICEAKKQLAEAEKAKAEAQEHQRKADQLRDMARGTDDVLSQVVAKSGIPLRIEPVDGAMRLTLPTARTDVTGRRTLFSELSLGEQTKCAAKIACKSVGRGGLFTLSQDLYEGLDPINRADVNHLAKEEGVTIITAEADDGALCARVLENNHA